MDRPWTPKSKVPKCLVPECRNEGNFCGCCDSCRVQQNNDARKLGKRAGKAFIAALVAKGWRLKRQRGRKGAYRLSLELEAQHQ